MTRLFGTISLMAARKSKTGTPTPPAKPPYHHGDLRRALIDASLDIIEKEGVSSLTLRYAARRAGVSHAAPKYHFGDLRGLHCAIAEEGYHSLRRYMERARASEPDADAARELKVLGMAYVQFASCSPGHFRAMFHPKIADRSDQPALELAAQSTFGYLLEVVQRGQNEGQFRGKDARNVALAAWSLVHGLATLATDNYLANKGFSSTDPVVLTDQLSDLLAQGIRAGRD